MTQNNKNIVVVVGTRPEVIKMAPLILALKKESWVNLSVIATAQHRDLLDQEFKFFEIQANKDLDIMAKNQTLPELTANLINSLNLEFVDKNIDLVLAQGDTTTTFVTALVCFYNKIKFYHVEAGLRSFDLEQPFPEEMNRILTSKLSDLHFTPTELSKNNLVAEGIGQNKIFVTGNTVVDALLFILNKNIKHSITLNKKKRTILVTAHRRENFGEPIKNICRALLMLANEFEDIEIVYPVHPNPNISEVVPKILANHQRIILIKPLDYGELVALMKEAYFIISDSGGIQEEAPVLGKPVLILRNTTERLEGVLCGLEKLVGTDPETIYQEAKKLLIDHDYYTSIAKSNLLFGDGHAADRIVKIIQQHLN